MKKYISIVIFLLFLTSTVSAGDKLTFLKKQFTTQNGYKLNYRVLYPKNYVPGKKYPVILFLHGAGERGSDNEAQLIHGGDMFADHSNRIQYPAIIIAPQCPKETKWIGFKINEGGKISNLLPSAPISKPLGAVKELLDSFIKKEIVDTEQIHITGLSMGGMGTFDLLCRYPNLFASATPICGAVNLDRIARYKGKTAIRLYHGADDRVVEPQNSRDAFQILLKNGTKVSYKEYPGVEHNSWDNTFAEPDYLSWMFEQKRE